MSSHEVQMNSQTAHNRLLIRTIYNDIETPVSAFLKLGKNKPYAFLFESVEGGNRSGRYSIITLDPDLIWKAQGEKAYVASVISNGFGPWEEQASATIQSLKELVSNHRTELSTDLPPMAMGLFGAFGYDIIRQFEPLGPPKHDEMDLPDSLVVRPQIIMIFDNVSHQITLTHPIWGAATDDRLLAAHNRIESVIERLNQPLQFHHKPQANSQSVPSSPIDQASFCDMVEKAKDYIRAGDIFQVVLSHRFSSPYSGTSFSYYRALRRMNPSPYLFYLNFDGFELAGSSPEILVKIKDGIITSRPIAGTRPRGANPAQDLAMEKELLADPKECSEHLMLLDLGRNDVGRVAVPGSVKVTEQFVIERYSHVLHIVSNVEGQAPANLDPVDALLATLPAGTLSGAPKVRAMEIIDELEPTKRGIGYGGGVGYISADGSIDVCIVLRTALFKDGHLMIQAGAGIVADSNPISEYEETQHKAGVLIKAAQEAWHYLEIDD
jgi:anthranilate synthase component 1